MAQAGRLLGCDGSVGGRGAAMNVSGGGRPLTPAPLPRRGEGSIFRGRGARWVAASIGQLPLWPGEIITLSPSHLVTKSPRHQVTKSPRHQVTSVTKSPRHQVTSSPSHLVTKSPRHQVTSSPSPSSPRHLVTSSPRHLVTKSPSHLVTSSPRHQSPRHQVTRSSPNQFAHHLPVVHQGRRAAVVVVDGGGWVDAHVVIEGRQDIRWCVGTASWLVRRGHRFRRWLGRAGTCRRPIRRSRLGASDRVRRPRS